VPASGEEIEEGRGKREVACPRKEEEKDEEARSREETRANPEKHLATYLPTPLFIGLIAALHTDCVHFKDGLGLWFEKCKRVIIKGNCRLIYILCDSILTIYLSTVFIF